MTPEQLRYARKLLGWSTVRLAAFCDMDAATIRNFEFRGIPPPTRSSRWLKPDALATIRAVLESEGVEFTADDVRRRNARE